MERKTVYRVLLVIVIILAVIFTLGVIGVVPFVWSEYITVFMVILFFVLRFSKGAQSS
ncbi:conserved protein of unknown function [Thermococcus nautili]|jgi:predicted RND superfamily exporter protein|uniref:hypothetical protein n=1 Tax=Thermococcus nautili TaxID=195522 RepID=UPI002556F69B|nr:hypothetical protein [Thermococcus nautili]CAI1493883.1 conserved protein of unknown function [Thermococcus nautili]